MVVHIRPSFLKMKILLLGSLLVLASGGRIDNLPSHSHSEHFDSTSNNDLHINCGPEDSQASLGHSGSLSHSLSNSQSQGLSSSRANIFSVGQGLSHFKSQQGLNQHGAQYQQYTDQGQVNSNLRDVQGRNTLSVLSQQSNRNQFTQGQQSNRNEYNQAQQFNRGQFSQGQQSNRNQFSLQNQQANRNQLSLQNQQANRNQFSFQDQQANRNQFSLQNQQANRNQFSLQNQQANRNQFSLQNQQANRNQFQQSNRNQFSNDNQQSIRDQFSSQNRQANQNQFSTQNQQSVNSQVSRQGQYYQRNNQGNNQQYSLSNSRVSTPNLVVAKTDDLSSFGSQNQRQNAQFRSNQNQGSSFRFDQNQGSNTFQSHQNQGNNRFQSNLNLGGSRTQSIHNQGGNTFQVNRNLGSSQVLTDQNLGSNRFQLNQNQGSRFHSQAFGLQNQQGHSSSFRNQDGQNALVRQDQHQNIDSQLQSHNNQFQQSGNQFQTSNQQFHSSDKQVHQSQNAQNSQLSTSLQTSQLKEIAGHIENTAGDKVLGVFQTFTVPITASLAEGQISSTFSCSNYGQGYFADPESSCRMFHVCTPVKAAESSITQYRFTFRCGEGEEFDQRTLTCSRSSSSCNSASSLFYSSKERSQHLFSGFSSSTGVSAGTGPCYLASDNIITGWRRK